MNRQEKQDNLVGFHRRLWDHDGKGISQAMIVRPAYVGLLLLAGQTEQAHRLMRMTSDWRTKVNAGAEPWCLACDYVFKPKSSVYAFSTLLPWNEVQATEVMVCGVCKGCSEMEDEELMEVLFQHLRKSGFADRKIEYGTG